MLVEVPLHQCVGMAWAGVGRWVFDNYDSTKALRAEGHSVVSLIAAVDPPPHPIIILSASRLIVEGGVRDL